MDYKIDKYFRHIKNFDVSHYVWIYESQDRPLLQTVHSLKKIGTLKDHQKKIARVLAFKNVKKKNYYYLEVDGDEIGWSELKTSPVIYSRPREHVKLNLENFIETQEKQIFVVSKNNLRLLKDQMLDSRFMMIKDGVQYEALFKKHRLQGWFSSDTLIRSEKAQIAVKGYQEDFAMFEFNNLTSEVGIDEEKIYPITIVHMFREIGLAKIKTGMGNYWTDMSLLEYNEADVPKYEPPYTFDEIVVYDLIQNISEERKMTLDLIERLNSQFEDTNVEVEPTDRSEEKELDLQINETFETDESIEDLKEQLEVVKTRSEEIEKRYKNLKSSFFGRLQTKYWKMRK